MPRDAEIIKKAMPGWRLVAAAKAPKTGAAYAADSVAPPIEKVKKKYKAKSPGAVGRRPSRAKAKHAKVLYVEPKNADVVDGPGRKAVLVVGNKIVGYQG